MSDKQTNVIDLQSKPELTPEDAHQRIIDVLGASGSDVHLRDGREVVIPASVLRGLQKETHDALNELLADANMSMSVEADHHEVLAA